jgi:hypothetical protein
MHGLTISYLKMPHDHSIWANKNALEALEIIKEMAERIKLNMNT